MLLRIRWFLLGVVGAVVTATYVAVRSPYVRRQVTGPALRDAGLRGAADLLDAASVRVASASRR
ncbi:MAG: hypothetical protein PVI35_00320 [Acidimicrobiia bacterium]|jgi:hypothetical protein